MTENHDRDMPVEPQGPDDISGPRERHPYYDYDESHGPDERDRSSRDVYGGRYDSGPDGHSRGDSGHWSPD